MLFLVTMQQMIVKENSDRVCEFHFSIHAMIEFVFSKVFSEVSTNFAL